MKEVTYKEKEISVQNGGEERKVKVVYKSVDGKEHKKGTTGLVTDKHATWLEHHGYIEPIEEKENKKAKTRETK